MAKASKQKKEAAIHDQALERGIDILIEPLNPYDMPGYFLSDYGFAAKLIRRLARKFDVLTPCFLRLLAKGM